MLQEEISPTEEPHERTYYSDETKIVTSSEGSGPFLRRGSRTVSEPLIVEDEMDSVEQYLHDYILSEDDDGKDNDNNKREDKNMSRPTKVVEIYDVYLFVDGALDTKEEGITIMGGKNSKRKEAAKMKAGIYKRLENIGLDTSSKNVDIIMDMRLQRSVYDPDGEE